GEREREGKGDFGKATNQEGSAGQIFNPQTGQPYQLNSTPNVLAPTSITTAAQSLLNYIPLPNMASNAFGQNFHYVTSANSSSDIMMFQLVHNFSAGGPGGGPFFISSSGPGGSVSGSRRRRHAQNNINFELN